VPPGELPAEDGPARGARVVVGVDGSDGARSALVWALVEAARRGAGLVVLSAFPVDFYWTDAYLLDPRRLDAVRADTDTRARAMVDEARRAPAVVAVPGSDTVPVQVVVVAGAAAEHLVNAAADADLLVVGSRGRSGVRSTLVGSVALHCTTHARCPVVVVHPQPATATEAGSRVVVGLDDSDMSRDALRHAVTEAARLGAEVEGVVAYHPVSPWSELYTLGAPLGGELEEHARRRGEAMVAEVLGTIADGASPPVRVVAVEGPAGHVLVRRAEGAALLVVGSRSRSRLRGMVLGSVALDCVVHGTGPVMVVHPAAARATAPLVAPALA
jgi:nucleotide-binding universal stress UspA family protein